MVKVANTILKTSFYEKITGAYEIKLSVLRSKTTKEKISSKESILFYEENEYDFDDGANREDNLDSGSTSKSLTTTNLSATSSEEKIPETKKQRSGQISKSIKDLSDGKKEETFGL